MRKLAEAIKIAAERRERSFSHQSERYTKTIAEAADEAAESVGFDTRGSQPIYLLLKYCWNDILAWTETHFDK